MITNTPTEAAGEKEKPLMKSDFLDYYLMGWAREPGKSVWRELAANLLYFLWEQNLASGLLEREWKLCISESKDCWLEGIDGSKYFDPYTNLQGYGRYRLLMDRMTSLLRREKGKETPVKTEAAGEKEKPFPRDAMLDRLLVAWANHPAENAYWRRGVGHQLLFLQETSLGEELLAKEYRPRWKGNLEVNFISLEDASGHYPFRVIDVIYQRYRMLCDRITQLLRRRKEEEKTEVKEKPFPVNSTLDHHLLQWIQNPNSSIAQAQVRGCLHTLGERLLVDKLGRNSYSIKTTIATGDGGGIWLDPQFNHSLYVSVEEARRYTLLLERMTSLLRREREKETQVTIQPINQATTKETAPVEETLLARLGFEKKLSTKTDVWWSHPDHADLVVHEDLADNNLRYCVHPNGDNDWETEEGLKENLAKDFGLRLPEEVPVPVAHLAQAVREVYLLKPAGSPLDTHYGLIWVVVPGPRLPLIAAFAHREHAEAFVNYLKWQGEPAPTPQP